MAIQDNETDLANVVDSALDVLGKPAKRALYYHLAKSYDVQIKPGKPMVPMKYLHRALTSLLGHGAAEAIVDRINKQIA